MMLSITETIEDTRAYYSEEFKELVLTELYHNAYRTLRSVFMFEHFDEYIYQLQSDRQEDKNDVYWKTSYYERLTDYIKIAVAFENYNKAVLIENGYLVHRIQKGEKTKDLWKLQEKGQPVRVSDFMQKCEFVNNSRFRIKYYLEGLKKGFPTVSYSQTLSAEYQQVIKLNERLVYQLKELNEKRNRLHFFTDFKGAFSVSSHIEKWLFIKDCSLNVLEQKLKTSG
jgi:hypothetical protein